MQDLTANMKASFAEVRVGFGEVKARLPRIPPTA
jgi:hypothetical protein